MLFPKLLATVDSLTAHIEDIPPDRVEKLSRLTAFVEEKRRAGAPIHLNFICTHNSRRSHLGMIWAHVAALYNGIDGVVTFSGGTEATAFNPRAVNALVRAGFEVEDPGGENPHYRVSLEPEEEPLVCFSKVFDDPVNQSDDFAAIMTCSDADEHCPAIVGATRISLPYEDPKVADDTPKEADRYDERLRQIGTEMLAVFGAVQTDA